MKTRIYATPAVKVLRVEGRGADCVDSVMCYFIDQHIGLIGNTRFIILPLIIKSQENERKASDARLIYTDLYNMDNEMKLMGFQVSYVHIRLTRRTFWGLWDEWDDTALQTQD